jgi:hypothetical protein
MTVDCGPDVESGGKGGAVEVETGYCVYVSEVGACLWSDSGQPYVQLLLFLGSLLGIYLTMFTCPLCVFGIMGGSMVLCCQYRLMSLVFWASMVVLWFDGWRFGNGKGFSIQWN